MALNPETKYPSRRAYVLKLRSDAKPDALTGRIENLITGQQREFATARELLDSIACDLEVNRVDPSSGPVDADRADVDSGAHPGRARRGRAWSPDGDGSGTSANSERMKRCES